MVNSGPEQHRAWMASFPQDQDGKDGEEAAYDWHPLSASARWGASSSAFHALHSDGLLQHRFRNHRARPPWATTSETNPSSLPTICLGRLIQQSKANTVFLRKDYDINFFYPVFYKSLTRQVLWGINLFNSEQPNISQANLDRKISASPASTLGNPATT